MTPIVSLCIPTYNGEPYLRQALQSACAQTVQDIEILVVDDGSKDGTVELVEEFARQDPRVILHRNQMQMGLPGNWDCARELARGKWVAFLFQDDLAEPQYLERMLSAAAAAPTATEIVCCRREFLLDSNMDPSARDLFLEYTQFDFARYFPGCAYATAADFSNQLIQTPMVNFVGEPTAVLLGGATLTRFGRFHRAMRQIVDLEYWARVATVTGIAYVDEPLVKFRVHAKSATSKNRSASVRMDRADSVIFLHDMLTQPGYAMLRRSPLRVVRLLKQYCARMYEVRKTGGKQNATEPAWADMVAVYPALQRTNWLQRLSVQVYSMWRAVRS